MTARDAIARMVRTLLILTILAAPFLVTSSAQAHALLQSSTPADGASYDHSPQSMQLVFTDPVEVPATSVLLYDGAGRPVALDAPVSEDGLAKTTILDIPLPQLPKDRYLVRWRTISVDDLHPAAGSIVFGIGTGVSPAGQSGGPAWTSLDSIAESVLRWVALMSIGFALAALMISVRVRRMRTEDVEAHVLPRATTVAALVGVVATSLLAGLYLARIADVGGWLPIFTAWQFTLRWVVAVAAVLAAWWILRRAHGRSGQMTAVALLTVSLVAITSTSHPISAGIVTALLSTVHTVTTMVWACGAAVVAVVAVPALRRGDRLRARATARAFTPIAVVMVPVSLMTGLLLAGALLPSIGAVLHTDYGQALLIKLAILAVALLAAGATVWLLVAGEGRHRASLIVGVEASLLAAVVLAASTLAATHPAARAVWAPTPETPATSGVLSDLADDLVITADVGPGRPGRNFITVGVLDTRRPAPAPVAEVDVSVDGQPALSAVPQGRFQWLVVTNITDEGRLPVIVSVHRPGEPTAQSSFMWNVGPAVGTKIGGAPLSPVTSSAAVAVAALALLAGGIVVAVRRRRRQAWSRSLSATSARAEWSADTSAARAVTSPHGSGPNS